MRRLLAPALALLAACAHVAPSPTRTLDDAAARADDPAAPARHRRPRRLPGLPGGEPARKRGHPRRRGAAARPGRAVRPGAADGAGAAGCPPRGEPRRRAAPGPERAAPPAGRRRRPGDPGPGGTWRARWTRSSSPRFPRRSPSGRRATPRCCSGPPWPSCSPPASCPSWPRRAPRPACPGRYASSGRSRRCTSSASTSAPARAQRGDPRRHRRPPRSQMTPPGCCPSPTDGSRSRRRD